MLELAPMQLCDEATPNCERCADDGAPCQYDAGPVSTYGINEEEDLRFKLQAKSNECQEALFLLRIFRHGSEEHAAALLARLRIGHDVSAIIDSLKETLGLQSSTPTQRQTAESDKNAETANSRSWENRIANSPWSESNQARTPVTATAPEEQPQSNRPRAIMPSNSDGEDSSTPNGDGGFP
ncbi:hypothetical protein LTR53_011572 [Teratosphaeriaceae sp. CCFEE 6253]|nr:hypothetical protein LTR53_011572 [Teratosphaeriaceae sp. CCFEE 6253]